MGPRLIPALGTVTHKWSEQVLDTIDYAGFIGLDPATSSIHAYPAVRSGHAHGVAGAMINAALILGQLAPWVERFTNRRGKPRRHRAI